MKFLLNKYIITTCLPILLSIACINTTNGQAPGLAGKRLSLYYNLTAYPHFVSPGFDRKFKKTDHPTVGINYRHNFDFDYVLNLNTTVGLSFKTLKTGDDQKEFYSFSVLNNNNIAYRFTEDFVNMKSNMLTLSIKKFFFKRTGAIAPIGTYFKFETGVCFTSTFGDSIDVGYGYDGREKNYKVPYEVFINKPFPDWVMIMGIGQQKILGKRYYFDYGLEVGILPLLLMLTNERYQVSYRPSNNYNVADIAEVLDMQRKKLNTLRLQNHILMNGHIGTGIIF